VRYGVGDWGVGFQGGGFEVRVCCLWKTCVGPSKKCGGVEVERRGQKWLAKRNVVEYKKDHHYVARDFGKPKIRKKKNRKNTARREGVQKLTIYSG